MVRLTFLTACSVSVHQGMRKIKTIFHSCPIAARGSLARSIACIRPKINVAPFSFPFYDPQFSPQLGHLRIAAMVVVVVVAAAAAAENDETINSIRADKTLKYRLLILEG